MEIHGHYYPPGRSQRLSGVLSINRGFSELVLGEHKQACDLNTVEVSVRVARMPRSVTFADGGRFDTDDDNLEQALVRAGYATKGGWVHHLEQHWRWALLALVLTPPAVWGLFQYGFPVVAKPISAVIPHVAVATLDSEVLEFLDDNLLKPSAVDSSHHERAARLFARLNPQNHYRLLIRKGEQLGANALALPAGTIIVTDELLELVEQDGELLAIFAHEIGHIQERHALRQIVQSSGVVLTMGALFGDLNWVTDVLLVSAPTFFQQMAYSRTFEREADDHARAVLMELGVSPGCFASILGKLEASHASDEVVGERQDSFSYWSSHPPTERRIAATGAMAQDC